MTNLMDMSRGELQKLETALRRAIAKHDRKLETARRRVRAMAKSLGCSVQELVAMPGPARRTRIASPRASVSRRVGRPRSTSPSVNGRKTRTASRSRRVQREVSVQHKQLLRGLPTAAAKIRALLPFGYTRQAIATAVGTTYHNVYQVEKAPKAKGSGNGRRKRSGAKKTSQQS